MWEFFFDDVVLLFKRVDVMRLFSMYIYMNVSVYRRLVASCVMGVYGLSFKEHGLVLKRVTLIYTLLLKY